MASEEKSAWIMLILAIAAAITYPVWVLSDLGDTPLVDAPFTWPMLWTIAGSIVLSILLHIVFAPQMGRKDQREREIHRFSEYTGYAFITIGALAAMIFAALEFDHFWIANVIFACFLLSAIISSIAKIVAFRSGLPRW